jgi:hypothetical protein
VNDRYPLSRVLAAGGSPPFYRPREGDLQACLTISLRVMVWRTVPGG